MSDAAISTSKVAEPLAGEGGYEMPRHVAIIMDGNGRWAAARGLPRVEGHRRGVEALRKTVRAASDLGIAVLTIFSFSSENWSRPQAEIRDLLALLRRFIRNDLADLHKSNVQVRVIGEREDLPSDIRALLEEADIKLLCQCPLAGELARQFGLAVADKPALACLSSRVAFGVRITPDLLARHLDEPNLPDPDVIIRTSGEQRLSNFLLWQAAYSELVFVPINWPDFDHAALEGAIAVYRRRERRFGGLIAQTGS